MKKIENSKEKQKALEDLWNDEEEATD